MHPASTLAPTAPAPAPAPPARQASATSLRTAGRGKHSTFSRTFSLSFQILRTPEATESRASRWASSSRLRSEDLFSISRICGAGQRSTGTLESFLRPWGYGHHAVSTPLERPSNPTLEKILPQWLHRYRCEDQNTYVGGNGHESEAS